LKDVLKRNGELEPFVLEKIETAVAKALKAAESARPEIARAIAEKVMNRLMQEYPGSETPDVERIQDVVEEELMASGLPAAAKAYILHRHTRARVRSAKRAIASVSHEELKLSTNAISVLERRYLLKDLEGAVVESPAQLFRRVAKAVAAADARYGEDPAAREEEFYGLMARREFMPNTPTLMNAGTPLGLLSACFVLPIDDSLDSIFKTLWDAAKLHQAGGGTGFSFSRLRPKGDMVRSTRGVASGPLTFMSIFDKETDVIKQGGKRRGANMAILRVDHPDILEFITVKSDPGVLANFNLSVAVTDDFMEAVKTNGSYDLFNPRTGAVVRRLRAREVWDLIVTYAWKTGDPGVVFIDEVNRRNPTSHTGIIDATNPCGEQPLHPYDSCNLGSINLGLMLIEGANGWSLDWGKLGRIVRGAVHFLDNVIDVNRYPVPEIEAVTKANRRIGLGVMGFADMLCLLGVPYDGEEALGVAEKLMRFINEEAHAESGRLAELRGSFPNFKGSMWEKQGWNRMRNATSTTVAPTGTISIIAGCSSGIEPLFAVAFVRNVLEGTQLFEVNWVFEELARRRGVWRDGLSEEIARSGTLAGIEGIPEDLKRTFVTALEIDPEWHVRMQAAFQKHCDNAVSKTINFPIDASVESVERAYSLAHRLGTKGLTVYRYGSKPDQVLTVGSLERKRRAETTVSPFVTAGSEYAGGCPTWQCPAPA
jgi:ribonucleoside-diphosphate reductase alpha chain